MATEEEIRIVLRTLAEGQGAQQTRDQLRGVRSAAGEAQAGVRGVSGGFKIGAEDALRFAGALTGVGLGLSLAASAGRLIQESISGAITAQAEAQRVARATAAAYGAQADAFTAFASTLSAGTGFTKTAILEAALSARTLSENYGLTIQQTQRLIAVSADLARIRGIGVAEAFERVQSAIRGEAEASEFLGLTLNATFLQQNAQNGALRQTFTTLTDVQRAQVVYGEVLRQTEKFQGLATSATGQLDDAMLKADLAGKNLAVTLGKIIEPATVAALNAQTAGMNAFDKAIKNAAESAVNLNLGLINALKFGTEPRMLENPPVIPPVPTAIADRSQISGALAKGLSAVADAAVGAIPPVVDLTTKAKLFNEQLRSAELTLARFSTELGQLETRSAAGSRALERLARSGDVVAQGAQAAENILRRIDTDQAQRLEERARGVGRLRELLVIESQVSDPRDFSAQTQAARERLQLFDRLVPLEQARAIAAQAQSEAQARISVLDLQQQQRQLDVAQPLADLRTETLLREVKIADVQRQEADLADRITLSSRQNLDLVRKVAQEREKALPSAEAQNDNQFDQRRLQLQIAATRADVRLGRLDPSALQEIPTQRQELRQLRREAPRLDLNALVDARPGELLERQVTREQLQQTIKLSTLQEQQRVLEDQLIPLRAAQRLTDERTAAIQRQLELQQLAETSARTAAQQGLLAANAVGLAADIAVKKAVDWASAVQGGLANISAAWQLLATLPQPTAPPPPVPAPVPTLIPGQPPSGLVNPDRQRSPVPTPTQSGNTFNVNVTFTGPVNDPQAVAREVLSVLEHAADSAPQAAPIGLAGAIG